MYNNTHFLRDSTQDQVNNKPYAKHVGLSELVMKNNEKKVIENKTKVRNNAKVNERPTIPLGSIAKDNTGDQL